MNINYLITEIIRPYCPLTINGIKIYVNGSSITLVGKNKEVRTYNDNDEIPIIIKKALNNFINKAKLNSGYYNSAVNVNDIRISACNKMCSNYGAQLIANKYLFIDNFKCKVVVRQNCYKNNFCIESQMLLLDNNFNSYCFINHNGEHVAYIVNKDIIQNYILSLRQYKEYYLIPEDYIIKNSIKRYNLYK